MRQVLGYTLMLLRAYRRDRVALFFGFFFPLIFMGLFGILNFGSFGHVALGIVDNANNADSQAFRASLAKIETLQVTNGSDADEQASLKKGDRDIVLTIPADFKIAPARAGQTVPTLTLFENAGRGQQVAVGEAILTQVIDQMSFAVTQSAPILTTKKEQVEGRNLKYVDFLTPGILGMTIMQLGVASVMFTFVVDRQRGVIRRIMATPISRRNSWPRMCSSGSSSRSCRCSCCSRSRCSASRSRSSGASGSAARGRPRQRALPHARLRGVGIRDDREPGAGDHAACDATADVPVRRVLLARCRACVPEAGRGRAPAHVPQRGATAGLDRGRDAG